MNTYKVIWCNPDSEGHVEHLIKAESESDAYIKAIDNYKYSSYRHINVICTTGTPVKSQNINPDYGVLSLEAGGKSESKSVVGEVTGGMEQPPILPTEPVEQIQLLQRIAANTRRTAFWTGVIGLPVLISFFTALVIWLEMCSRGG